VGSRQQVTVPNSASQDIASRALAAARRVDEAKQLYSKAEAVWVYAQRSGDYELQNKPPRLGFSPSGERANCSPRWQYTPALAVRDDLEGMEPRLGGLTAQSPIPQRWQEIDAPTDHPSKWQQIAKWISALSSKSRMGSMLYRGLHSSFLSPAIKASLNK
jgi:hypothetical protein